MEKGSKDVLGNTKVLYYLNRPTLLEVFTLKKRLRNVKAELGGQRIRRSKRSGLESESKGPRLARSRPKLEDK